MVFFPIDAKKGLSHFLVSRVECNGTRQGVVKQYLRHFFVGRVECNGTRQRCWVSLRGARPTIHRYFYFGEGIDKISDDQGIAS